MVKYKYVIICDDDNWLSENYIQKAYDIIHKNPNIGMLGGKGVPVFENGLPPKWFSQFEQYYAVGKQSQISGKIVTELNQLRFIWGAGAVLNMAAYDILKRAGFKRIITYKKYPQFARCEDLELCLAIQLTEFDIWYEEELIFHHEISHQKLNWHFLIKLSEAGALVRPFTLIYQYVIFNKTYFDYNKFYQSYIWFFLSSSFMPLIFSNLILRLLKMQKEDDILYFMRLKDYKELYSFIKFYRLLPKVFNQIQILKDKIKKSSLNN